MTLHETISTVSSPPPLGDTENYSHFQKCAIVRSQLDLFTLTRQKEVKLPEDRWYLASGLAEVEERKPPEEWHSFIEVTEPLSAEEIFEIANEWPSEKLPVLVETQTGPAVMVAFPNSTIRGKQDLFPYSKKSLEEELKRQYPKPSPILTGSKSR